jgi:hypothetical protein
MCTIHQRATSREFRESSIPIQMGIEIVRPLHDPNDVAVGRSCAEGVLLGEYESCRAELKDSTES